MGVITKMLYRGQDLKIAPYRNLFVDMEENIHIHYRDLRIELSRLEFEEIANTFRKQSEELLTIIQDRNYEDGKLPNSNQEDTRIWTDSRLNVPVKYHPKRISIEECTDGFHIHLRNYKFLLSPEDFNVFHQAMLSINLDVPYASTAEEILQLFDANEMDFVVTKKDKSENKIEILAASYHVSKIRTICEKIGLSKEGTTKKYTFTNNEVRIDVTAVDRAKIYDLKKSQSINTSSLLVAYLVNNTIDGDSLNYIKAQILDLFNYAKSCSKTPDVDLDFKNWTYDQVEKKVNFPFKLASKNLSEKEIKSKYRLWSQFQKEHDLFFVKPTKLVFDEELQLDTQGKIFSEILNSVAVVDGVQKIYVMGSVVRREMGLYKSPFIHSEWAKLGSDVDILIEMEEESSDVPEDWKYINLSSNTCDIYHLNQVVLEDKLGFETEFPHINYFHHLLDAYVYFPDKSDEKTKDNFLTKFAGKLIYSKDQSIPLDIEFDEQVEVEELEPDPPENPGDTVKKKIHKKITRNIHFNEKESVKPEDNEKGKLDLINKVLNDSYSMEAKQLERLLEATENELYKFEYKDNYYLLKCFKVSGNYRSSRIKEHTDYEAEFVAAIENEISTAKLVKDRLGNNVVPINDIPSVLYTYENGKIFKSPKPNFPINEASAVIAELHKLQFNHALTLSKSFSFDDVFNIWEPEFYRFMNESADDGELAHDFAKLKKMYKSLKKLYRNITKNKKVPWLHNHGDVTPRNFLIRDNKAILIDFQNAFYGPRILDVIDGAYEFSFGGKPPSKNDFNRFDEFILAYKNNSPLTSDEEFILSDVIKVCGIIKFIKEVRMIKGKTNKNNLRRLRALSVSQFLTERYL